LSDPIRTWMCLPPWEHIPCKVFKSSNKLDYMGSPGSGWMLIEVFLYHPHKR